MLVQAPMERERNIVAASNWISEWGTGLTILPPVLRLPGSAADRPGSSRSPITDAIWRLSRHAVVVGLQRLHVIGAFESGRLGDGFLAHRALHLLDGLVFVLGHPLFGL